MDIQLKNAINASCESIINSSIPAIVSYVRSHMSESDSQIIQSIRNSLQFNVQTPTQNLTTFAAPLLGPAVPSLNTLASSAPPAGTGSGSKKKKTSEIDEKRITIQEFKDTYKTKPICAYFGTRKPYNNSVCGKPATCVLDKGDPNDPLDRRCDLCKKNKGKIKTEMGNTSAVQGIQPQAAVGINIPLSLSGMPQLGQAPLPPLSAAVASQLPFNTAPIGSLSNIPSLPSTVNGLSTLPLLPNSVPTLQQSLPTLQQSLPTLQQNLSSMPNGFMPNGSQILGNRPAELPVTTTMPSESPNVAQSEDEDEDEEVTFDQIQGLNQFVFPSVKAHRSLVCIVDSSSNKTICYGKLSFEPSSMQQFADANWFNNLSPIIKDTADSTFLQENNVLYYDKTNQSFVQF